MADPKDEMENKPMETVRYENQQGQKTGLIDPDGSQSGPIRHSPPLKPGQSLTLKNKSYQILELISHNTLEAEVYRVQDVDGKIYALKLYHEFADPNREPNQATLSRIHGMDHPDILKLYDFGVGSDKYENRRCFEISAFAEGGDMFADPDRPGQQMSLEKFKSKYTPEFLEKVFLPQVASGLQQLHAGHIIHCDLKPSNLFYLDKNQQDILIGDYGSAKAYEKVVGKSALITQYIVGTVFYKPPEHAELIVSFTTDYFSLGAILIHLLYPEQIGKENNYWQVDDQKKIIFHQRLYNTKEVIDFEAKKGFKRINQLIEGFVRLTPNDRFGEEQLQQWLNHEKIRDPRQNFQLPLIKVAGEEIHTESDFVSFLERNKDPYKALVQDATTYAIAKQWLQQTYNEERRKVFEQTAAYVAPLEPPFRLEALLRFFEPERSVQINDASFDLAKSRQPEPDLRACIEALDLLWKASGTEAVLFPLFQIELSLWHIAKKAPLVGTLLIDKVYAAFGVVQDANKPGLFRELSNEGNSKLLHLFYHFREDRGFRDETNQSLHKMDEIAYYFAKSPKRFEDKQMKAELFKFMDVYGPKIQHTANLRAFLLEALKDKAETRVELTQVSVDRSHKYDLHFNYFKSLNAHLSGLGIAGDYTDKTDKSKLFTYTPKGWVTIGTVFDHFLKTLEEKHKVANLDPVQVQELHSSFRNAVYNNFFRLYNGQAIAAILMVPLAFFFWNIATKQLRIDHQWRLSGSPHYIPPEEAQAIPMDTVVTTYYQVLRMANLRDGASANAPVVKVVPKGAEVEMLNGTRGKWVHIAYEGQKGYMSTRLLAFGRQDTVIVPISQNTSQ